MVTTQRQFFRSHLRTELKQEKRRNSIRKMLKASGKKPSFHNVVCVSMGLWSEVR